MGQCKEVMKSGELCKVPTKSGKRYCHIHRKKYSWKFYLQVSITLFIFFILPFIFAAWLFNKKLYEFAALTLMYETLFIFSMIESAFQRGYAKKIVIIIKFATLIGIASVGVYFKASVANEGLQSNFLLEKYVSEPINNKPMPQSFWIDIDKDSSPIYLSLRPSSDSHINLKVYDPDNRIIVNIPNYHLLVSRYKHIKHITFLVYEVCLVKSGRYNISINQNYPYDGAVTLKVFTTNWNQFIDIDYSNCP